jgi:hypothetical protein
MHAVQEEEEKIRPKKDRVFGGAKMGQKSGKEPGQTREERKTLGCQDRWEKDHGCCAASLTGSINILK